MKITNFTRNFWEMSVFPGNFEGTNSLKNYEKYFSDLSRNVILFWFQICGFHAVFEYHWKIIGTFHWLLW